MPFITKLGSVAARAYGWLATTVSVAVNDAYFYLVSLLLSTTSTNGAQNNTFLDSSPNNFTITRNGNTTQGTFSPFSQTGWSNYFDGTGDYLTTSASSALTFGTGNFTIEAWIYPQSSSGTQGICGVSVSGSAGDLTIFYNLAAGKVSINSYGGTRIDSITSVPLNVWTHIAFARQSGTTRVFINGALDNSAAMADNFTKNVAVVGRSYSSLNQEYFTGYTSNLRLVKGTALYTAAFTPPTAPLTPVTNTSLLTCNSQSFVDTGPNNFTITRNGDTKVTANSPFAPSVSTPTSYSGWFDGTGDYLSLTATSALTLPTSTTPFTVEVWVYPTASGGVILAEEYLGGANPVNLGVWLGATGQTTAPSTSGLRPSVGFYGGGATWSIVYSSVDISLNAWTHIAAVFTGSATKIYVNGVDQSVNTITTWTTAAASRYFIGKRWDANVPEFITGLISNLRWVIGTAVYTSNFTPPTAPLTAISGTALLTCQNATFIDNSTNAFALTVNGNAQPRTLNPFGYTTTQPVAWSASLNGGAAYFDGTGDYLSIADNAALDFGSSDFTIECWFYPLVTPNNNLCAKRSSSAVFGGAMIIFSSSLSPTIYATTTGSTWEVIKTSTVGCVLNSWNHIAFTRSSTTWTIFVNGVSGGSVTVSGTIPDNTAAFTVGAGGANGDSAISQSYVSNFRVVKGTAVYTGNFNPPVAPVTPVTGTSLLLNYTNAGIYDAASQTLLETVGNAQVSTTQAKWGSTAVAFDGTGDWLLPPLSPPQRLTIGTGDFTIEFWVYFNSGATTTRYLIDWRPSGTEGVYPTIYTDGSSLLRYYVSSATRITGSALSATTWTHIAVARSGTSTRMFVNGTQVGSTYTDSNNYLGPASRPVIGTAGLSLGTGSFSGYMDDLRITVGYARYTTNFTPPSAAFPTQ